MSIGHVPDGLVKGPAQTTREERALMPFARNGKALFAICFEWYCLRARRYEADIMYCLATDEGDARVQYLRAPPPVGGKHIRIVAIAAAIGYHVTDDHADHLTAG